MSLTSDDLKTYILHNDFLFSSNLIRKKLKEHSIFAEDDEDYLNDPILGSGKPIADLYVSCTVMLGGTFLL